MYTTLRHHVLLQPVFQQCFYPVRHLFMFSCLIHYLLFYVVFFSFLMNFLKFFYKVLHLHDRRVSSSSNHRRRRRIRRRISTGLVSEKSQPIGIHSFDGHPRTVNGHQPDLRQCFLCSLSFRCFPTGSLECFHRMQRRYK